MDLSKLVPELGLTIETAFTCAHGLARNQAKCSERTLGDSGNQVCTSSVLSDCHEHIYLSGVEEFDIQNTGGKNIEYCRP